MAGNDPGLKSIAAFLGPFPIRNFDSHLAYPIMVRTK